MFSTNGTQSGGDLAPQLPVVAGNEASSVVDSASTGLSSSMKERMSSLSATIKKTLLPDSHQKNNADIETHNTKIDDFLREVKNAFGTDLADADIRELVVPSDFDVSKLPDILQNPIKERLAKSITFEALQEIILQSKTEEKSILSLLANKAVHCLVDLGRYDFNLTPKQLADKKKTHTFEEIKNTFEEGKPFIATGKIIETVYNKIANRAVTLKYNPIDMLALKAYKIGHDASSHTLTKGLLAVPLAIFAFGLKLALKMGRGLAGLVSAALTPFALLVGAICYAVFKYALVPCAQAVGRQIGYYDNDVKKYCDYKFREAKDKGDIANMVIYATGVSPFSKLNVTAEGVKAMKNDEAYQTFKKAEKAAKEAAKEAERQVAARQNIEIDASLRLP